jgi:hypothetical protein
VARISVRTVEDEYPSHGYWGEITVWGADDGSDPAGPIYIEGPMWADNPQRIQFDRFGGGNINYFSRFNLPSEAGEYTVEVNGQTVTLSVSEAEANGPTANLGFGWNGNIVTVDWQSGFSRTEQEDYDPDGESIDPSDYAGIVNADNEEGIALAPRLRREGAELGSDGAMVNLPDGETVEVGAISEADEVARYVDGDDAGDVIDSDQPATDSDSSRSGAADGMGAAGAALGVLALGYALTWR